MRRDPSEEFVLNGKSGMRYHTYYGKDKMIMPTDDTEANRLVLKRHPHMHVPVR